MGGACVQNNTTLNVLLLLTQFAPPPLTVAAYNCGTGSPKEGGNIILSSKFKSIYSSEIPPLGRSRVGSR